MAAVFVSKSSQAVVSRDLLPMQSVFLPSMSLLEARKSLVYTAAPSRKRSPQKGIHFSKDLLKRQRPSQGGDEDNPRAVCG